MGSHPKWEVGSGKWEVDYFQKLIDLMDRLRGPGGCPWDLEQTRETLKPMLIEEAYEVLEALDDEDPDQLCEELGDLLFQVIFHSRIGQERGEFDAHEVCRRVYEKMVRRHPHVFGDAQFADSKELLRNWEDLKAAEKAAAGRPVEKKSLLDGIPEKLPALHKAQQITAKAGRVGFDWDSVEEIHSKYQEEFGELQEALRSGDEAKIKEEVGDLLFTALNVARFLEIDAETALGRANAKFAGRFQEMESHFQAQGRPLKEVSPAEMNAVWEKVKSRREGMAPVDSVGKGK